MKPEKTLCAALGVFQALRTFGFSADDIRFNVDLESLDSFIILRIKPDERIDIMLRVGKSEPPKATLTARWNYACQWWNVDASDVERTELWNWWLTTSQPMSLVTLLANHGLQFTEGTLLPSALESFGDTTTTKEVEDVLEKFLRDSGKQPPTRN